MPIKNRGKWYDAYYDKLDRYSGLKHYWNLIHLKKMDFFNKTLPDSVIVDIGCGNGNMLRTLYAKGYRKLYGFDVKIPEVNDKEVHLREGSMLDMPYPEKFADTLICFNVMHHLLNQEQYGLFLDNCKKVLKRDGKLFFVEPQRNFFRKVQDVLTKIPIISNIGPIKGQKIAIEEEKEEIDKFLDVDIQGLFEDNGFHVVLYKSYLKSFILCCEL